MATKSTKGASDDSEIPYHNSPLIKSIRATSGPCDRNTALPACGRQALPHHSSADSSRLDGRIQATYYRDRTPESYDTFSHGQVLFLVEKREAFGRRRKSRALERQDRVRQTVTPPRASSAASARPSGRQYNSATAPSTTATPIGPPSPSL